MLTIGSGWKGWFTVVWCVSVCKLEQSNVSISRLLYAGFVGFNITGTVWHILCIIIDENMSFPLSLTNLTSVIVNETQIKWSQPWRADPVSMSQQSFITFSPKQYTLQHIPNKLQDIAYLSPNFVVLTLQLPELMHTSSFGAANITRRNRTASSLI